MRKALYILGSLDDGDIEWMAEHGAREHIRRGDTLVRENVPINSLYILLEGKLSVRVGGNPGNEIAALLPGEIVGEISFIDNRKPTASVIALEDSRVFALDRALLSVKLARDPAFASRFYRAIASFLADRLYMTTARLGYGSPGQDVDADTIEDSMMDEISLATIRFDKLLRYLAEDSDVGSFAAVKE